MAYADYSFYTNVYIGNLSESEFMRLSERASEYIDSRTAFLISDKGIDNFPEELAVRIKKACCAVSDALHINQNGGAKLSESVGGDYSVSYAASPLTDEQRLDNAVFTYIPDLVKAVRWI